VVKKREGFKVEKQNNSYNILGGLTDGGLVSAQGICRRTVTARTQLGSDLSSRERSGSVADRKTEMCSIFDIYDKCVAKECDDHMLCSYRERNAAQTRYSLWWPAQWAPTTQHQSPPRGLVNSPAHTYKCALT